MNTNARCAVITGGLGSLGFAVAQKLLADGWQVAIVDVAQPAAANSLQDALVLGGVDLTSADETAKAIASVAATNGRIDAVVNVAGTFRWQSFEEDNPVEAFDAMYTINLRTAVLATRAALPFLLAQSASAIVSVGAASATSKAVNGMAAYAASKAGVAKLTESLADEFKDRGLRVNAVLPGIIDTAANRKAMPDADTNRWVPPSDIADVVSFLLSDQSRSITGALIPVVGRL